MSYRFAPKSPLLLCVSFLGTFFLSLILFCYLPYCSDLMFNHGIVFLEVVFLFVCLSISSGLSNFLAHYFFKKSPMNLCIFVESDLRHLSFLILFIWVFSCIITLHKSLPILFIFFKSNHPFHVPSYWFYHLYFTFLWPYHPGSFTFLIFGLAHPFSNILSCKIRALISNLWVFLI